MALLRLEDPPIDSTKELCKLVLTGMLSGNRVNFLCKPGDGGKVVQRLRVFISRERVKMKRKNKKQKYFKIHHSVHSHTEQDGKRFDSVIMWHSRNDYHLIQEEVENLGVN